MSTTAIIVRDNYYPPVHVLECDGPRGDARVNHTPRTFLGTLTFEEFCALPDHDKELPPSGGVIEFNSATRIVRLLQAARDSKTISLRQINEILRRMEVLFPLCTECVEDMLPPRKQAR